MSGIPLWMHTGHVDDDGPLQFRSERYMCGQNPEAYGWEKVIARPKPEDEAREAVIAAAREYLEWDGARNGVPNVAGILLDTLRLIETRKALVAALDALTKGDA